MGEIMFDIKALHDLEITELTWKINGHSDIYKCYKNTALGPHTDTGNKKFSFVTLNPRSAHSYT
eukprot:2414994-Ditylum_brightwellii.AAC.1